MARVSLMDIPNAPQVDSRPAMGEVPSFGFDGQGAAGMLNQRGIAKGEFDRPAEAWQSLGDGVIKVAAGTLDLMEGIQHLTAPKKQPKTATVKYSGIRVPASGPSNFGKGN